MRFIKGLELFNFEIVSKMPNMVFVYISMAFSMGMTPKQQNRAYLPFYTFFYNAIIILTKNAKDPKILVGK